MDPSAPTTPTRTEDDRATRVLGFLLAARKALQLYPSTNPQVRMTLDRLKQTLDDSVRGGPLLLQVERDRFASAGSIVDAREADLSRLAFKLHCLNVREIEFRTAPDTKELVPLLEVLNQSYDTLAALGPLHDTLLSRGVTSVSVRYVEVVVPGRSDEARASATEGGSGTLEAGMRRFRQIAALLSDPGQFARELVRLCVEVAPAPGERKLDAQLAFVDRYLQTTASAIESEPAEVRPDLYEKLSVAIELLVRSSEVSGAKMGALPHVDLANIDPKVLQVLPQRDLVKEVSSKVKLHQGATTVMASALRQIQLAPATAQQNAVLDVIESHQEGARSIASNMQVLEEIRAGSDVDGEYPGIAYAERDKNKNFNLGMTRLPGEITYEERREAQTTVEELEDWRPTIDVVETVLDMLANETNANVLRMIATRLVEKLSEFLDQGELEPALRILRGLNVERRKRRDEPEGRGVIERALLEVEARPNLERLLRLAETVPVESPVFESIQGFLFLLDKHVIHTVVELVSDEDARYSRRRALALARFLCRNRLELLVEGLRTSRPEVAKTFVWLLGHFGREAIPHLRRAAHHPDPRVRREAVRGLATIEGEDAGRAIASLLADRDEGVVASALRAIAARATPEASPALEAVLAEDHFMDRPEDQALLFVRAASRAGTTSTLVALRKLEDRGKLRSLLKTTPLREGIRAAIRELEEKLKGAAGQTPV